MPIGGRLLYCSEMWPVSIVKSMILANWLGCIVIRLSAKWEQSCQAHELSEVEGVVGETFELVWYIQNHMKKHWLLE